MCIKNVFLNNRFLRRDISDIISKNCMELIIYIISYLCKDFFASTHRFRIVSEKTKNVTFQPPSPSEADGLGAGTFNTFYVLTPTYSRTEINFPPQCTLHPLFGHLLINLLFTRDLNDIFVYRIKTEFW